MPQVDSEDEQYPSEKIKETPLPWKQLSIYIGVRLAEPISATIIFPFIPRLIGELHIASGESVGYYVGFVESLFFITESIFVSWWGRLSDRIGRKPVLMCGLIGVAISGLCFGLSKTFLTLILSRALLGALNGNVAVIRSALGELADESNIGRIYSFLPLSWWSGATIGPLIGGYFAHPADRFPSLFGGQFWQRNPYFLPCAIAASLALSSCIFAFFFMEETHPILKHTRRRWPFPEAPSEIALQTAEENDEELSQPPTPSKTKMPRPIPFGSLLTKRVKISLVVYGLFAFLEISIMALLPIFLTTTLRFSLPRTGIVLGTMGFINGVTVTVAFVPVRRAIGTRNVIGMGCCAIGAIYTLFPLITWHFKANGSLGVQGSLLLGLLICLPPACAMSFTSIFLYIRAAAPSLQAVGATNGIAQSVGSIARALGPAVSASLFAYSAQRPDIANGALVWCFLGVCCVATLGITRLLPEEPWERGYESLSMSTQRFGDSDDEE